jgi:hypothetical protein
LEEFEGKQIKILFLKSEEIELNQRASEKFLSGEEKVHRLQSFCEAPVVMRSTEQREKEIDTYITYKFDAASELEEKLKRT